MSMLEKNLEALPAELASQIRETAVPAGFEWVRGTDGTMTFARRHAVDGKKVIEWLGHTSMPTAAGLAAPYYSVAPPPQNPSHTP